MVVWLLAVAVLLTTGSSLVASSWLLCRLRPWLRLSRPHLFARQLAHVAMADLLTAGSLFARSVLLKGPWEFLIPDSVRADTALCQTYLLPTIMGSVVSALVEAHIAVSFACAFWRRLRVLALLSRTLHFAWLLGLTFAVTEVLLNVTYRNGKCELLRRGFANTSVLEGTIFFSCFAISLIAYFSALFRVMVWRDPGVVQTLVWRTAWVYPASFFITYIPINAYFLESRTSHAEPGGDALFYKVAIALEGLSGLLNTVCFACGSRYVSHRWSQRESLRSSAITERSSSVSGREGEEGLCDFVSFHVAFRSSFSEVIISEVHAEASNRSELMTAELETEQTRSDTSSTESYIWEPPPDPLLSSAEVITIRGGSLTNTDSRLHAHRQAKLQSAKAEKEVSTW